MKTVTLVLLHLSVLWTYAADSLMQPVEKSVHYTTLESVSPGRSVQITEIKDEDPEEGKKEDGSDGLALLLFTRPETAKSLECTLAVDLEKIYRATQESPIVHPFTGPGKWRVYSVRAGEAWKHFLVFREDTGLQARIAPAHQIRDGIFVPTVWLLTTDDPELLKVLNADAKPAGR